MEPSSQIDKSKLPQHIAIIMDGNGRWAEERGQDRLFGHLNGVESVRNVVEGAAELGVKYLTLYAFSTENWERPPYEVSGLMELLVETIKKEVPTLNKNNIRLQVIGDVEMLPDNARKELEQAITDTAQNNGLTLILALSYSSRWEIVHAIRQMAAEVASGKINAQDIDKNYFERFLCTTGLPDPELLIRTGGEIRVSNFLLYQIAYAELYFTEVKWPDFRKNHLFEAIIDFQHRQRRFGKTGKQVVENKPEC
ncbi:MAG: isoprenyl transferase [Ferruginibacter sp.]|nr:isoprenyl transferase [Ferruginibacter sp.]